MLFHNKVINYTYMSRIVTLHIGESEAYIETIGVGLQSNKCRCVY